MWIRIWTDKSLLKIKHKLSIRCDHNQIYFLVNKSYYRKIIEQLNSSLNSMFISEQKTNKKPHTKKHL